MSFLSKVFGVGGKGSIDVIVDKPHYIAGELIQGSLLVQVHEPIECNEVVITVIGKEAICWTCTSSRYENTNDYSFEEEFLQEKLILFNVQQSLLPGNYVYPFEYMLPQTIPGSFDNATDGDAYAEIAYSLTGALSINGILTKDLKKKIPLTVFQQWIGDISSVSTESNTDIRLLNLLNKGQCHVRLTLDKNVYEPNQVATIQCEVDNDTKQGVKSIQFDLIRTVQAKKIRSYCSLAKVICTAKFPGIPSNSQLSQEYSFELKGNSLCPSTRGKVLSCSYRIEMTCNIPFCPDIILAVPIDIVMPRYESTSSIPIVELSDQ